MKTLEEISIGTYFVVCKTGDNTYMPIGVKGEYHNRISQDIANAHYTENLYVLSDQVLTTK